MSIKERLLDIFYPPSCIFCGTVRLREEPAICPDCAKLPLRMPQEICLHCGRPLNQCDCTTRPHLFDRALSCFVYKGGFRRAITHLKYKNDREVAQYLAGEMAKAVRNNYKDASFTGVIPVPMEPKKRFMRGYNPPERLARLLARELGLPLLKPRLKRLGTRQQHSLAASERMLNAYKGYQLLDDAAPVTGRILLVDDLQTTGATLDRCAFLLRQLGAEEIWCICAGCTTFEAALETETEKAYNKECDPVL